MRDDLEQFVQSLDKYFSVAVYMDTMECSKSAAYRDFREHPGLAVRYRGRTLVSRDFLLELLALPPQPWLPLKERKPNDKRLPGPHWQSLTSSQQSPKQQQPAARRRRKADAQNHHQTEKPSLPDATTRA